MGALLCSRRRIAGGARSSAAQADPLLPVQPRGVPGATCSAPRGANGHRPEPIDCGPEPGDGNPPYASDEDANEELEAFLDDVLHTCQRIAKLDLPPAASLFLSDLQRQLTDFQQFPSEAAGRPTLNSLRGPELSPREHSEWCASYPGAGNLIKMFICMAARRGGDSERWFTGRLSVSDTGTAFDSTLFSRSEALCTGIIWWSDVVNIEVFTLHVGGAEVLMSFHEDADVSYDSLRLQLGTVGDAEWLREVWRLCKAPQANRRSARRTSLSGIRGYYNSNISEDGTGVAGSGSGAEAGVAGESAAAAVASLKKVWQEVLQRCQISTGKGSVAFDLCSSMSDWQSFDIFELAKTTEQPLAVVGMSTLVTMSFLDELGHPLGTLYKVLSAWERGYKKDVAYHTSLHAADVTHSVYHALTKGGLSQLIPHSVSIAMLFASVVHDIGHPGVDNRFLVANGDVLAIRYNDRSPLENMHCATAFEILRASGVNLFGKVESANRSVRKHILSMVLGTDMAVHHAGLLQLEDALKRNLPWDDAELQEVVTKVLVHLCDIGNPTRPYRLLEIWTGRVMEEFFKQADLERELGLNFVGSLSRGHCPLDRHRPFNVPSFQLGFAKNVVLSAFEVIHRIPDLEFTERFELLQGNIQRLTEESERRAQEIRQAAGSDMTPNGSTSPIQPLPDLQAQRFADQ